MAYYNLNYKLSKMMNMKSVGLQVLWILLLPIGLGKMSPALSVGRDVPRDGCPQASLLTG
jgi:hypothetical protein